MIPSNLLNSEPSQDYKIPKACPKMNLIDDWICVAHSNSHAAVDSNSVHGFDGLFCAVAQKALGVAAHPDYDNCHCLTCIWVG